MAYDFLLEVLGGREGMRVVLLPGGALVLRDGSCDGGRWCEFMFDKHARRGKGENSSPSTLLISPAPKPVKVLLCFGRVKPGGPTGPLRSEIGAPVLGRRSRGGGGVGVAIMNG